MVKNTIAGVIRFTIAKLPLGQIFCSKDLLKLATREQVDNILSRLVKGKVIVRLANGVFCRNNPDASALPSLEEIREAKARVFQRRLGEPSAELSLKEKCSETQSMTKTVYTTSATSSMSTIYGRVYYRRTSARWLKPFSVEVCGWLSVILRVLSLAGADSYLRTAICSLTFQPLFS